MKRKVFTAMVVLVVVVSLGYLVFTTLPSTTVGSSAPVASAAKDAATKKTYSAMLYVAGMGGHIAEVDVTIDPNNEVAPIKINNLGMIVVGTRKTHPLHDVRIDVNDRNIMFWSTYLQDPDGNMRVGKTDLRTGKKLLDIAIPPDLRAPARAPIYCASAQTKDYFMPIFMGMEGFVDIFYKEDLTHKNRMFISDIGYEAGTYMFLHGINSPDMKRLFLLVNLAKDGRRTGELDIIMVDLPAFVKGEWNVLAKNTLKGVPGDTVAFRGTFTDDGKYIFQSAGDRLFVIDANTLELVDRVMIPYGGQIHDAIPTPDGKYGIITVRLLAVAPGAETKEVTDGFLMLYDFEARGLVGRPESVCMSCHAKFGLGTSAVLCGIDGNWRKYGGS